MIQSHHFISPPPLIHLGMEKKNHFEKLPDFRWTLFKCTSTVEQLVLRQTFQARRGWYYKTRLSYQPALSSVVFKTFSKAPKCAWVVSQPGRGDALYFWTRHVIVQSNVGLMLNVQTMAGGGKPDIIISQWEMTAKSANTNTDGNSRMCQK